MKKIILLAMILGLGTLTSPLVALDTGTVIGEGARPCREFYKASDRKKNNFIIWVQGYFSAYNAIAPDIQNIADGRNYFWIQKKLEDFCKINPDEYFNEAVAALVGELHPKGIATADPAKAEKKQP